MKHTYEVESRAMPAKPVLDLFHPPEPPSGPPAVIPTPSEGTRLAYHTWRLTDDGQRAWRWITRTALDALSRGELRVSPRTLAAACRDVLKVRLNDHFTPYLADDLIHDYPLLTDVVERRKRKDGVTPDERRGR